MSTARLEPMTGTPTETLTEALRSKLSNRVTSAQFDIHAGVNEVLKDVGLTAADSGGRYTRTDTGLNAYQGAGEAASREEHFDERFLVAQAKAGCSNAFSELHKRHRPRILRTAFRILRNKEDAEDAVQRSFHRAFTNLRRFRGDSSFSTWLTRIAINEALMILRHRRADQRLFESDTNDDLRSPVLRLADKGPTPDETLAENELRTAVTQGISHLRKNLQTVVLLREFQGLTCAEIARSLGVSVATVKSRIFHARRRLRRHLVRTLQAARNGLRVGKRNKEMGRCASGVIA